MRLTEYIQILRENLRALLGWSEPDDEVKPEYFVGDGLVVRKQYEMAEREFQRLLAKDPADVYVLLRLSEIMEAQGRSRDAAEILRAGRRAMINRAHEPFVVRMGLVRPRKEKHSRQDKILRLTFALGDILVHRLNDVAGAKVLYEETLELLFGFRESDFIRERLAALKSGRLTGPAPADVEPPPPDKIRLD